MPYIEGRSRSNWARTFTCVPVRFYEPKNEAEVQDIVRLAKKLNQHIRVTGPQSHSPSDIFCTSDWMMNINALCDVLHVDNERMRVTVEAGISITDYLAFLKTKGWTMPQIGSIKEQSLAGAISTGTHGSSINHGAISTQVVDMTLILASGEMITVSRDIFPDIFSAALLGLGSLGIITRLTMQAVTGFNIESSSEIYTVQRMLEELKQNILWNSAEYVRIWQWPYSERCIIWRGNKTAKTVKRPDRLLRRVFDEFHKRYFYQAMLYMLRFKPASIPKFERFIFTQAYGWTDGTVISHGISVASEALSMDCLFSQYVDEWSLPSSKAPNVLAQIQQYISKHGATGSLYVHSPIEIRVASGKNDHALLSMASPFPSMNSQDDYTCWIGVIMYRPYFAPTPYQLYFNFYEQLLRNHGGRPHWAKDYHMDQRDLRRVYGDRLDKWLSTRRQLDPDGIFVNE